MSDRLPYPKIAMMCLMTLFLICVLGYLIERSYERAQTWSFEPFGERGIKWVPISSASVVKQGNLYQPSTSPRYSALKFLVKGKGRLSVRAEVMDSDGRKVASGSGSVSLSGQAEKLVKVSLNDLLRPYSPNLTLVLALTVQDGDIAVGIHRRVRSSEDVTVRDKLYRGEQLVYRLDEFRNRSDFWNTMANRVSQFKPSFVKSPLIKFYVALHIIVVAAFCIGIGWFLAFRTERPIANVTLFIALISLLLAYDWIKHFWYDKLTVYLCQ